MKKLLKILKEPYPNDPDIKRKWKIIFGVGLFVVVFIKIFNLDDANGIDNMFIVMGFGLIAIFVITINRIILPLLIPQFFHEDNWYVLKEIFFHTWNIFLIGLGNLFYGYIGGYLKIDLSMFIRVQIVTIMIGIFPVTFIVLMKQIRLLKKNVNKAEELNKTLKSRDFGSKSEKSLEQLLSLSSESGRDIIQIQLGDLIFVKSVENYVEIYWVTAQGIQKGLLRSSLRRIEEDLNSYSSVFRCHRTYLVNMKNISRIIGNSQGYRLVLRDIEDSIPVSRSYSKEIIALLAKS